MNIAYANIAALDEDDMLNDAYSYQYFLANIDQALHAAEGGEIVHECRLLGGCKTGQAKLTKGYNLPASYIIHTVGPVWREGLNNEEMLLERCYQNCLTIAENHPDIQSVAFPGISTGIYGFPVERAAKIAIEACRESTLDITFCCFQPADHQLYKQLLKL